MYTFEIELRIFDVRLYPVLVFVYCMYIYDGRGEGGDEKVNN